MKTNGAFPSPENNNEDNGYDSGDPDIGPPDFDMPDNNTYNPEDIPPSQDKVWLISFRLAECIDAFTKD